MKSTGKDHEKPKVACPKCNGGLGYHKFGIDNPCQPCDLCGDTGEATEADAENWLDGQGG